MRSFLQGLSLDELKCLAEFQGACVLESLVSSPSPYRLLPDFFDAAVSERWPSPEDRAHKTFIVLEWLEHTQRKPMSISVGAAHSAAAA